MTEEEVRPYVGKPVRLTLDDGCVLSGTLYAQDANDEEGPRHYAVVSERADGGILAETIHAADRITAIEDVVEEEEEPEASRIVDDLGLLAARLAVGLGVAAHGAQKAYGWFGGPGPEGTAGFMEGLGFKPGSRFAQLASYNEIVGGTLTALGFGGPLGPAIIIAQLIVANATVHLEHGFFVTEGGVELGVAYAAGALALASAGYGGLSLDRALGLHTKLRHPILKTLAIAGGIIAATVVLSLRETAPPAPQSEGEQPGPGAQG